MNGLNGKPTEYPENALVPYPVILAASKGDPDAMKIVLQHLDVYKRQDKGASNETPQTTQPEQAAPAAPYYTINEAAVKPVSYTHLFIYGKQ